MDDWKQEYVVCFDILDLGACYPKGPETHMDNLHFKSIPEAIKRAEELKSKPYHECRRWFIGVPSIPIELNIFIDSLPFRLGGFPKLSDELKKSKHITCHDSLEDLNSILDKPALTRRRVAVKHPQTEKDSGVIGFEEHIAVFELYYKDLFVDGGYRQPTSSSLATGLVESDISVEKMIYARNLVYGRRISHVLRSEYYTSIFTKKFVEEHPLKMDLYEFWINDELMEKHKKIHELKLERWRLTYPEGFLKRPQ